MALLSGLCVLGMGIGLAAAPGDAAAPWEKYRGELPVPVVPRDNPWSEAKFQLGRRLFYDTRLSANGTLSCASCHLQALAFSDGRAVSPGATGEATHRNSQGLVNVAWHATLTWANPAVVSIEQQIAIPLLSDDPVEMGMNDHNTAAVLQRLRGDRSYRRDFQQAFANAAGDAVTLQHVVQALASFVRGIVSAESRYDQFQRGQVEFTPAEQRGMQLFFGETAECHHCHGSFNFNDQVSYEGARDVEIPFHNTGLYNIDGKGGYPAPNRGVFESTGRNEDMGAFRAPSLRNVAVTGPYMHDGSVATLAEVVGLYADGGRWIESGRLAGDGRGNPHRSDLIGAISLSDEDRADLVAFLNTLTDECLLHSPRFADPARPVAVLPSSCRQADDAASSTSKALETRK